MVFFWRQKKDPLSSSHLLKPITSPCHNCYKYNYLLFVYNNNTTYHVPNLQKSESNPKKLTGDIPEKILGFKRYGILILFLNRLKTSKKFQSVSKTITAKPDWGLKRHSQTKIESFLGLFFVRQNQRVHF